MSNPATVEDLAGGVSSQEEAVQVYTAARIAVDVDTDEEHEFLRQLAEALGIDEELAAQVDAAARSGGLGLKRSGAASMSSCAAQLPPSLRVLSAPLFSLPCLTRHPTSSM